ncbi:MAG: methyltransferase domain-containing protein [Deltaproteobacteria bacterium]|nr:methyltransferase domain-containing protein [Deltaproteobacteria bacterium]NIS77496.1 methyltransferase domain-containing protein [Deltaproteobacteria bacterium]
MDREKFNGILRGYWESQILFTATYLGIFNFLGNTHRSSGEVAVSLRLDKRGTEILLNALTGLGLIEKRQKAYRNSSFGRKHLVDDGDEPLTGFVLHNMDMWESWGDLPSVMKKGKPQKGFAVLKYKTGRHSLFNFALAMHQGGTTVGREIALLFDFSFVNSILDVGGCTGRYALSVMERAPTERVDVLDLPEMVREAKRIIRAENREELRKIRFIEGNFFSTDPGRKYDLVILSNIIHSLSEEECVTLFTRLRGWLTQGGQLLLHNMTSDKSGTHPPHAALFSVNMLVNTLKGKVHAERDVLKMLGASGIKKIAKKRTEGGNLALLCG